MRSNILLLMLVIFAAGQLSAADPGSVGFNFLKVSPGARNAAMGEIGTALPADLYGVYFNPAGIVGMPQSSVSFMHHEGIFDTRREFLGATTNAFGGALALGFDYFKVGDLEARDGPTEDPIDLFDAQDWLLALSYARTVGAKFSAGLTGKYAAEKIESRTADAVLLDAGLQFHPTPVATVGLAVRNVGSKPKFSEEEIDIPFTVSGGVSYSARGLTAALEVAAPKESDLRVNFGAEKVLAEIFALRAGYKIGYDEENFSAGAGFRKSIWQIDYAFVPFKSGLGSTHRFALTINFNS